MALATTTCHRRGTAATVAAIIRDPYSRAPASAPRMPMSRTAKFAPTSTVETGPAPPNPAPSDAPPPPPGEVTDPVDTAAAIAPKPTRTASAEPSPTQVDRKVRSLIHSERIAVPRV